MTWWWRIVCAAWGRWDALWARSKRYWQQVFDIPRSVRETNNKLLAELGRPLITTRRERREAALDSDRLAVWWTEPRMPAVEDTGVIVATPEDLAEIGLADPVTRTGRRHQGRHARPEDFEKA